LIILDVDGEDLPIPVNDTSVRPETGSIVVGTGVAVAIESIARLIIEQINPGLRCFSH